MQMESDFEMVLFFLECKRFFALVQHIKENERYMTKEQKGDIVKAYILDRDEAEFWINRIVPERLYELMPKIMHWPHRLL
jgi:hypothetical protein